MRPDNAAPLIAAARQRHELTRAKAIQAIRELDRAGTVGHLQPRRRPGRRVPVLAVFPARHPHRDRTAPGAPPADPAQRRSPPPARLRRLAARAPGSGPGTQPRAAPTENQRLRRQLAHALGDWRTSPTDGIDDRRTSHHVTVRQRSTVLSRSSTAHAAVSKARPRHEGPAQELDQPRARITSIAPRIWKNMRPTAVEVSMPWSSTTRSTPRVLSVLDSSIRCSRERPSRRAWSPPAGLWVGWPPATPCSARSGRRAYRRPCR